MNIRVKSHNILYKLGCLCCCCCCQCGRCMIMRNRHVSLPTAVAENGDVWSCQVGVHCYCKRWTAAAAAKLMIGWVYLPSWACDELIELSLLEGVYLIASRWLAWLGASASRLRWEMKQEIIIRRWAAPWKWHRRSSVTPTSGASGVCQSSLSAAAAAAGFVNISSVTFQVILEHWLPDC